MDNWLKRTRELQISSYGKDPGELKGEKLRDYVVWNTLAAIKELSEATDETRWKPWAVLDPEEPVIDKEPFLKEMVDVGHFIGNLLVAAGVSDEEYWAAYEAKMEVNRERQRRAGGYQSRKGVDKCAVCGRSFDDVGRFDTTGMCSKCGSAVLGKIDV